MITSGNSFVVSRQVYFQFFIKMLYQRILSRYKLWNATNVEVLKYGSRVDREGVGAGVSGDRGSPTKSLPQPRGASLCSSPILASTATNLEL